MSIAWVVIIVWTAFGVGFILGCWLSAWHSADVVVVRVRSVAEQDTKANERFDWKAGTGVP